MNSSRIEIRPMEARDHDHVLAFCREMFPKSPTKHDSTHWQWQYGKSDGLTLLAFNDGRIVGQRPLVPFVLRVHGLDVKAVWAPDFMVSPECRGKGVGSRLIREALSLPFVYVAIQSSHAPQHIYAKENALRLRDVEKFVYPHSAASFLERRVQSPAIRSILAPWCRTALDLRHARRTRPRRHDARTRKDRMGPGFNTLWTEQDLSGLIVAERSADFLTRRFEQAPPQARYSTTIAEESGRLLGYAVCRETQPGRFLISDIWARDLDPRVLRTLLNACLRSQHTNAEAQVTTCYARSMRLASALVSAGFLRRGGLTFTVHPANSGVDREELARTDDWYVTALDSDVDDAFRTLPAQERPGSNTKAATL